MEFQVNCPSCYTDDHVTDEGQHTTIFNCRNCHKDFTIRHRPDPPRLFGDQEMRRVQSINDTLRIYTAWAFSEIRNFAFQAQIQKSQEAAFSTINYLAGYEGPKTLMMGRRKEEVPG